MNPTEITILLQLACFIIGSIFIVKAGKQDFTTKTPILLIPAFLLIALSLNSLTFILILIVSGIIFYLPKKVNTFMGKADLLLYTNIFIIFITGNSPLTSIIMFITLGLTGYKLYNIQQDKEILDKNVPLIHYFAKYYKITLLIAIGFILILSTLMFTYNWVI